MKQFGMLRVSIVYCSIVLFQQFLLHFNGIQQFFFAPVFYMAVCKRNSQKKSCEHNDTDGDQCFYILTGKRQMQ